MEDHQLKASDISAYYAEYQSLKWAEKICKGSNYFEMKLISMPEFEGAKRETKFNFTQTVEQVIRQKIKARMQEIEFLFKLADIELC